MIEIKLTREDFQNLVVNRMIEKEIIVNGNYNIVRISLGDKDQMIASS